MWNYESSRICFQMVIDILMNSHHKNLVKKGKKIRNRLRSDVRCREPKGK